MSNPIQMLYLITRKEAWYALSDGERQVVSVETVAATERAGGRRRLLCDATWSVGGPEFFELAEFPNLAAVQQRIAFYEQAQIFRYYEIRTILGVEMYHE